VIIDALLNRADASGGIDAASLISALGRVPEQSIRSDGLVVLAANNEGVPFVLSNPGAGVSQDLERVAANLLGSGQVAAAVTR